MKITLYKKIKLFFKLLKQIKDFKILPRPYIFHIKNKTDKIIYNCVIYSPNSMFEKDKKGFEIDVGYSNITYNEFCAYMSSDSSCFFIKDIKFIFDSVDDFECAEFIYEQKNIEGALSRSEYNRQYRNIKIDIIKKSITYEKIEKKFDYLSKITIEKINPKTKFNISLYGTWNPIIYESDLFEKDE
jgi:hypothetical protein